MADVTETDLRTKILANAAVAALISTRLYPDLLPQDVVYPCANMVTVGGSETPTLASGTSGLAGDRIQINAWAVSKLAARNLADAIREAIIGYKGTTGATAFCSIFLEGRFRSFYEEEVGMWQVQQDFLVTHEVNRP